MTVYARLVNNEIEGVYDLLPTNWGDIINFDVKCKFEEEVMTQAGFVRIRRDYTSFNTDTHKMSDFPTYSVRDGRVYEHRELIEIDERTTSSEPVNRSIYANSQLSISQTN